MMDTSGTYIKMCDCPEIQEQRKWESLIDRKLYMWNQNGDFIANAKMPEGVSMRVRADSGTKNSPKLIWLPRQDQLQEMVLVNYKYEPVASLLDDFERWRSVYGHNKLASMEQLWLAFVMKGKYNKIWKGERWE